MPVLGIQGMYAETGSVVGDTWARLKPHPMTFCLTQVTSGAQRLERSSEAIPPDTQARALSYCLVLPSRKQSTPKKKEQAISSNKIIRIPEELQLIVKEGKNSDGQRKRKG